MAKRTVRLDDVSEMILKELTDEAGMSVSAVLKQGLLALRTRSAEASRRTAWEIYVELDLGAGGSAIASSMETRRGVQDAIRSKLAR